MLGHVLDRAVQSAQPAGDQTLSILRDPKREMIHLDTDLDRLSQVFINLISNAQKYCSAADPQLRIDVHRTDDVVAVDFVDNGAGIAEADRELIFEKFSKFKN